MNKDSATKIILVIISLCISAVIIEFYVRISGLWVKMDYTQRDYFARSDILGVPYLLKSNSTINSGKITIVTNSDGIRESREYYNKGNNVSRILCIGDSVTFGYGVDQEESYPKKLEKLLNDCRSGNQHYEVINGGLSGFNASDEANLLDYLNSKLSPDLILWLIVENDYDDSLSVNEKGHLIHHASEYAATNCWLELAWGLRGKYIFTDDFLLSMDALHQHLASGKRYEHNKGGIEKIDSYLQDVSYFYCLLRNRIYDKHVRNMNNETEKPSINYITRRMPVELENGMRDSLPEFKSIFLSPFYRARLNNVILKGIMSAKSTDTPVVLLSFDVPIELNRINGRGNIYFQDITEYLGMPYDEFRDKYNLGWDAHLNSKGNGIIAEAICHYLSDIHLIDSNLPFKKRRYDRSGYWEKYEIERRNYIANLKPCIDFKNFRNIHQIIGGIFPTCIFPIKGNARLSLILGKSDSTIFSFSGNNCGATQKTKIWVSNGKIDFEKILILSNGRFDLRFNVPRNIIDSSEIIDVQISCISRKCGNIKIDYIGFI